jgi:hemerythrin superfamily protein
VTEKEEAMAARTKPASGVKQGASTKTNANETKDAAAASPKQSGQVTAASTLDPSRSESGIAALEQDHRRVEQLFADYESAPEDARKDELVQQICIELTIHAQLEEEIFYPACREKLPEEDVLDEAQVEHDSAKLLIADLMEARSGDRFRDAKVSVLYEQVKHHVGEEEMPTTGIMAQARAHEVDSADLARQLKERKQTLQRRAAELRPTRAISLNLDFDTFTNQEGRMARNSGSSGERERDDRGRFVSDDDDDRDYRRSASRGGGRRDDDDDDRRGSRSRGRDDDDDRGGRGRGGWFGDSEGHREAARRRFDDDDDDRRGGSPSRGRNDDDDRGGRGRGWFGDSEGHREATRRRFEDDDDGRRSASSRGRDDDDDDRRGSRSRSRDDDDDRRRSRGRDDDDDRGSRSRSRDDDDDDRRGRGRGGWFGDSEGHAEAARRRWENEGGRSSRSRSRDDDRRSRSRGGSDEGHGGWFGDSRGHAQAARRGWENRR